MKKEQKAKKEKHADSEKVVTSVGRRYILPIFFLFEVFASNLRVCLGRLKKEHFFFLCLLIAKNLSSKRVFSFHWFCNLFRKLLQLWSASFLETSKMRKLFAFERSHKRDFRFSLVWFYGPIHRIYSQHSCQICLTRIFWLNASLMRLQWERPQKSCWRKKSREHNSV